VDDQGVQRAPPQGVGTGVEAFLRFEQRNARDVVRLTNKPYYTGA
jgi:hypothetical protein